MRTRYESRVTRKRWFRWEWAVDKIEDGQTVSTIYGTTIYKSIAYQTAHITRDHLSLVALLEATP